MIRDIRDLVERLRKNDAKAQICTAHEPPHSIQGEAADEIERLRARLAEEAPRFQPVGWYDYGVVKWELGLRPVNGGLIYVSEVAQSTDMNGER